MKFRTAPEVAEIAERLIDEHHRHLLGWRIEYLFRATATITNEKAVLGTARIIKGRAAFLARQDSLSIDGSTGEIMELDSSRLVEPAPFFVVEIALDMWGSDDDGERWGLTDAERIALVDHELCHCWVDDDGNPKMRSHSIEEFDEIVARHGLWKRDVRRFVEIAKGIRQLPLDGPEAV